MNEYAKRIAQVVGLAENELGGHSWVHPTQRRQRQRSRLLRMLRWSSRRQRRRQKRMRLRQMRLSRRPKGRRWRLLPPARPPSPSPSPQFPPLPQHLGLTRRHRRRCRRRRRRLPASGSPPSSSPHSLPHSLPPPSCSSAAPHPGCPFFDTVRRSRSPHNQRRRGGASRLQGRAACFLSCWQACACPAPPACPSEPSARASLQLSAPLPPSVEARAAPVVLAAAAGRGGATCTR